jgi:hypothetical protein
MKTNGGSGKPIEVLLVEDSPDDVRLTKEAFRDMNQFVYLHVVNDGAEAMAFLKNEGKLTPRPSSRSDLAGSRPSSNGRPASFGRDQRRRQPENDP